MTDITVFVPMMLHGAAGAVGGNIIGMIRRTQSWGPLLNSLLGAVGGLVGAQALQMSGQAAQIAALAGGNGAALETGLAITVGAGLALVSSAFKQPD